jgi:hypothetical protein
VVLEETRPAHLMREVINGNQGHSGVLEETRPAHLHATPSMAINGHQWPSVAISGQLTLKAFVSTARSSLA